MDDAKKAYELIFGNAGRSLDPKLPAVRLADFLYDFFS